MKQCIFFGLLFLCIGLVYPRCSFGARNIAITADKSVVMGDESFTLTASLSGFTTNEIIYVKGALYQDGSSNYFGYTQYDANWIKNGDTTVSQRQVTIGNWDSKIVVKSDSSDSGYKGEGDYKVKIGFYYLTGGNISSVVWSTNVLDIHINEPDPTITPSATPSPSPTPTKSPTPTYMFVPTNTIKPTLRPTLSPSDQATPSGYVLGDASFSASMETISPTPVSEKKAGNSFPFFLLLGLLIVVGTCGTIGYLYVRRTKMEHNE